MGRREERRKLTSEGKNSDWRSRFNDCSLIFRNCEHVIQKSGVHSSCIRKDQAFRRGRT